ncbi:hypothetical protein PR048_021434 [Dryococelus australis]|uniref:Uncharacterized protein n=1 Tax=Dryococelus australis TaxID=614101 RepID=A0ABQ9GY99_9NEOP|nr:hypothetical protein PR048_021434 [Dryococelus australis]
MQNCCRLSCHERFPHTRSLAGRKSMSTVDELVAYATIACALQKRRKCKRKIWTKQWFQRKNRFTHVNLLTELRCYPKDWTKYLRMDEPTYLELLSMQLEEHFEDLKFSCHIAPQTLGKRLPDTCEVIFKAQRNYCKV